MTKLRTAFKKATLFTVLAVQFTYLPAPIVTFAQASGGESGTSTTEESTSTPDTTGIQAPTGASAHTYTYNVETGLWENSYYTWNPVTKKTTPRYDNTYSYNPSSGMWEKIHWFYSPSAGAFKQSVSKLSYDPYAPVTIENTGPESNNEIENGGQNGGASIENTGAGSNNQIIDPVGDTSISNTGANSDNQANLGSIDGTGAESTNIIGYDSEGNAIYDVDVDANINNTINSFAQTGNANVLFNTNGGNATTGDAMVQANVLNMVQSAVGVNGAIPNLYTANIQGDYFGDIVIDPGQLLGVSQPVGHDDLEVNVAVDQSIDNDIDLYAGSGDATVGKNTNGGNATTGDATAIANVINMLNSAIATGESFIGVLNINGNFEGDVLVADDVIDQLIASNVPTTEVCLCNGDTSFNVDNDVDQTINNNIVTTASSGEANVNRNTVGGNATSGSAETHVTAFNLTGQEVVAENAMLVFVNVLGEWVGFITEAPEGATAALLGGGVESASVVDPYASNGDTEYNVDVDQTINNDFNIVAETGDATVSMNTTGGDATSGDAYAAANVANVTNSNFALNNWFGMLFINIMGDWSGSFGVDTPFGDPTPLPSVTSQAPSSPAASQSATNAGGGSGSAVAQQPQGTGVLGDSVRIYSIQTNQQDDGSVAVTSATEVGPTSGSNPIVTPAAIESALEAPSAGGGAAMIIAVSGIGLAILLGERLIAQLRMRQA